MSRFTRITSAVAAAVLSLGIAAPAVAAPHGGQGGNHAQAGVVKSQKSVLRSIASVDKQLVRIASSSKVVRLSEDDKAAVLDSIAADRAALVDLVAETKAAKTNADLRQVRAEVKAFRVQNYTEIAKQLEVASGLLEYVEELRADIEADETILDPAALEAALDAAELEVLDAADTARTLTSLSSKTELRAVATALRGAEAAVDAVDEAVWGA